MTDSKVADPAGLDFAVVDGVLQRLPAGQAGLRPAVGAVEEEEVDVTQAGGVDGLLDGAPDVVVGGAVVGELGGVEDVLPREALRVVAAGEKVADGVSCLALVVVHLRTVKAAVAGSEGRPDGLLGFLAGHQVQSQLNPGHRESTREL